MRKNNGVKNNRNSIIPIWLTSFIFLLFLGGCSDNSDSGTGFIQLYNISANSPSIYLTVDQYDDDEYNSKTYSGVEFKSASSRLEYEVDTYDIEIAWQDEFNDKFDLELLYDTQLRITENSTKFIVIAEDIKEPKILIFDVDVRDEDERDTDYDDEVFNIRILNMHPGSEGIDIYLSESDETFNQAKLITQTTYTEMSQNQKVALGDYIFYITGAGNDDILYQSNDISFLYSSEYTIIIRENDGAGASPFIIDKISTSSVISYPNANSEAKFRIYNGLIEHELLPSYHSTFDVYINGKDDSPEISSLNFGEFSESILMDSGDYSMSLLTPIENKEIIKNHLLVLNENSDKTVFFYLLEQDVDLDGDGDVDEDGDGFVDEIEITINSLVVDNSQSENIYSHQFKVINLIDEDDYGLVNVYFVRNDETIESAEQFAPSAFAIPQSVYLLNNTFMVYVIGQQDSSDIILTSVELTLTEESKDQFLVIEANENSPTGYSMTFISQNDK